MFHSELLKTLSRPFRPRDIGGFDLPDVPDGRGEDTPVPAPVNDPAKDDRPDAPPIGRSRIAQALSEALSPSHPVADRSHLFGREQELDQLFRAVTELRAHAFLYGARGAGKTSLARAFGDYADERGLVVIYQSCESGSSFADIFRPYLDHLAESCLSREAAARTAQAVEALRPDLRPRALASTLQLAIEQRTVLIVDEFDRVDDPAVCGEVATLLKLMSDMRVPVHLLLVGIARDAQELVEGHDSLRRHLVAIGLGKFSEASSSALLDDAEHRSGLRFDSDARHLLMSLAAGSPYHLRLFALCAGLAAVESEEAVVRAVAVVRGLRTAFDNWAELNPLDARNVTRAAERGLAERRNLEALALLALGVPAFTKAHLVAQLRPALGSGDGEEAATATIALLSSALSVTGEGEWQFRDTLAPQFLLLACCFADGMDRGAGA